VRDPVVDKQRDSRVGAEVGGFAGGGVRGHYYQGAVVEGGGWKVGVIHEGDVGCRRIGGGAEGAGREMELEIDVSYVCSFR